MLLEIFDIMCVVYLARKHVESCRNFPKWLCLSGLVTTLGFHNALEHYSYMLDSFPYVWLKGKECVNSRMLTLEMKLRIWLCPTCTPPFCMVTCPCVPTCWHLLVSSLVVHMRCYHYVSSPMIIGGRVWYKNSINHLLTLNMWFWTTQT